MSECNSLCRNYTTEKGYLCDKEESSNLEGKKWCKIDNNDIKNYGLYLSEPYTKMDWSGTYFWDYIEDKSQKKICINEGRISYNRCSFLNNFNYYLGVLFMLLLPPTVAGGTFIYSIGGKHFKQTIELSTATNKQLLIFLIGKLRELAQNELVNNGKISQEELSSIIQQLKDNVNEIDENDTKAYGRYVKNILSDASKIIKNNEKTQSELYPSSVMDFFINYIPDEYALEVLKGANFATEDDGTLYKYTKNNLKGYGRFSSHASNETQFGYTDMFVDSYLHMLCGVVKYDDKPSISWCQFEGAPMPPGLTTAEVFKNIYDGKNLNREFLQEYIDHTVDSGYYFAYSKIPTVVTTKLQKIVSSLPESIQSKLPDIPTTDPFNLAMGRSPHTDANPIYILPLNLQELNAMPKQTTIFYYFNNSFTHDLGIYSATLNNSDIISLEEHQRTKQYQKIKQLGLKQGVNNTNTYLPNTTPSATIFQPLMVSMGGKYKRKTKSIKRKKINKTKKNRIGKTQQGTKGKKSHKNKK
jgi:polyhydroxyalkanoate synthesis regulator phasin